VTHDPGDPRFIGKDFVTFCIVGTGECRSVGPMAGPWPPERLRLVRHNTDSDEQVRFYHVEPLQ